MIGRIQGTLLHKQAPEVLVDVAGLGYEVFVPLTCFYNLPATGQQTTLYTHFVVREDAQLLFGFSDIATRDIFRELIKVNGVGPKMGLAILSALDRQELIDCVLEERLTTLVRVPGIGKKTAERLLIELRDRVKKWGAPADLLSEPQIPLSNRSTLAGTARDDAHSALLSLGYKAAEADKALNSVEKNHAPTSGEEFIKLALKQMLGRS